MMKTFFLVTLFVSCSLTQKLIGNKCVLNGRTFVSDSTFDDGCNLCRCIDGIVSCTGSIKEDCIYHVSQTTESPKGSCEFDKEVKLNGEEFIASDDCNKCYCFDGEVSCEFSLDCLGNMIRRRSLNG
ncbi:von Willebrand factor C and EGF domain-containing protein [Lepeophtheirus salmonis]|uniref:Putative LOC100635554 [Amphimedon queenslandica] n=1 Tax=Lepeophtheirus salmonis TaxID=72036 RepID=A0A0K2URT8_LEPSM|nr:kielin/chordin-like protein [Lepeophtheirus salmonis]